MKFLLACLLLVNISGATLKAEESIDTPKKPESDISSNSKKVLKKAARKVRDTESGQII